MRATRGIALAGAVALASLAGCGGDASPTPAATPARKPNIVLLLTDDLDAQLHSTEVMPQLKALVADRGTSFQNAFVTVALCCPSRTTLLRGQYAQNTQIFTNSDPGGGFLKVRSLGLECETVAVWLQAAGYRTALYGKYLNGYPRRTEASYVPPGWDDWAVPNGGSPYSNFDYQMNEKGTTVVYGNGAQDYMTDVLSRKAVDFIRRTGSQPFFLEIATYAPHGPATPAPRHQGRYAGASAPRTPSFDEADVSDKPAWLRTAPRLTAREIDSIDELHRKRLESLLAVDELIGAVFQALEASGTVGDTYFVFTSDNGFHLGQHRQVTGKQAPYEEEMRVPLVVRGPGVPAGRTLEHLVGNVDLAPTFADLGGAAAAGFVDGRSLRPLLGASPPPASGWRQGYLIMHGEQDDDAEGASFFANALLEPPDWLYEPPATAPIRGMPPFAGLRTPEYKYVELETGERELYDLRSDPYELQNLATSADRALVSRLSGWLATLSHCAGAPCRAADAGPP